MKPRMVAITFDPTRDDTIEFHQIVLNSPKLISWAHYIMPTYLIMTTATPKELETFIASKWGERHFFFVDIEPRSRGGYLPTDNWDWMSANQ